MQRIFIFDKPTKNSFRFNERNPSGEKPVLGAIYLRQDMFPDGAPEAVELTVTPVSISKKK